MHAVMMSEEITPVNIGNPDEYTIKECAELILKFLGGNSKITYQPLPQDDPKKRRPNIDKLQRISTYRPTVSFEEGLRKTAEYFKSKL